VPLTRTVWRSAASLAESMVKWKVSSYAHAAGPMATVAAARMARIMRRSAIALMFPPVPLGTR
jgi:hypothetical protein